LTKPTILAACRPEDSAIEDCEVKSQHVAYFLDFRAVGTVNRISGQAIMRRAS
jgi:hypothetical protein